MAQRSPRVGTNALASASRLRPVRTSSTAALRLGVAASLVFRTETSMEALPGDQYTVYSRRYSPIAVRLQKRPITLFFLTPSCGNYDPRHRRYRQHWLPYGGRADGGGP